MKQPEVDAARVPRQALCDGACDSLGLDAFVRRWWVVTFVTGDDWRVAAAVGLGLLATWGFVEANVAARWLLPLVVLGATAGSLHRVVLRER
jgi:hypothetical protein